MTDWPTADDPRWLEFHFARCRGWLEEALSSGLLRTHAIEHVWEALTSGECQIWPKQASVAVTQLQSYPTGKKALCIWLAGGDLKELKATHVAIEQFAKSIGCDALLISGRKGWLKALGDYRENTTSMVKEIR